MKISVILFASLLILTSCGSADKQTTQSSEAAPAEQVAQVQNIDASTFQSMMKRDDVVVIDVRTANEVAQGYISGTTHFIDIRRSDFAEQINALDTSKTYLMYCRSGGRSGRASEFMIQNGFNSVYNLKGGITRYSGDITK